MKKILLFIFIFFLNINVGYSLDTSKSSVVIDMDSGRILYEKNKDDKRLIASITNIMTI
jgi:D-alanyl-D-alanine carboxypeptidase